MVSEFERAELIPGQFGTDVVNSIKQKSGTTAPLLLTPFTVATRVLSQLNFEAALDVWSFDFRQIVESSL